MKMFTIMTTIVAIIALAGCATAPQSVAESSGLGMPSAGTMPSVGSAAGIYGGIANAMQTPGLIDILVQQLGVSSQQASGGAGSIFSVAQQVMSPTNFGLVSKAVPDMSQILASAPASGATPNLMGSAANALGSGSRLGQMAALASSFQSLGMSSGMMGKFIPVILDYVQNQGGSTTMSLLQSAIMR